jgi:hypothetical protein
VIFDASGEVADTLGYGEKSLGGLPQVFEMAGGVRVDRREVFPSWALWARVGWDSIQVHRPVAETMDEGVVTVLRLNAQRDTIFRRDLRYAPRGVEERVRDSVIDARLASYSEQVQHAPALRQAVVAMTEVPMFYPPVQSVVVTDDGFVWLCRGSQDSDGWDWFLLGASGDLRGKIVLPVGALIVGRHDDALYTSETDEFGVPWLVRYHMGSGA